MAQQPPCRVCGTTTYKRTREHVYPRSWKQHFGHLDREGGMVSAIITSEGREIRHAPRSLFEGTVSRVCEACNRDFLRHFDEAALPILQRLAIMPGQLEPHEIMPMQLWAYKTLLVQSLQDPPEMSAPGPWLRLLRETSRVPDFARLYIARMVPGQIHPANSTMEVSGQPPEHRATLRAQCIALQFGTIALLLVGITGHEATADGLHDRVRRWLLANSGGLMRPLGGTRPILLWDGLPASALDHLRKPIGPTVGPALILGRADAPDFPASEGARKWADEDPRTPRRR